MLDCKASKVRLNASRSSAACASDAVQNWPSPEGEPAIAEASFAWHTDRYPLREDGWLPYRTISVSTDAEGYRPSCRYGRVCVGKILTGHEED